MGLLEDLRKKLPKELMAQVEESLGDDTVLDYVPRTRLNKVIQERNSLRKQLEEDDSLETPPVTKPAGAPPEASKGLTQADLDQAVAAVKAQAAKDLADLTLRSAVTEKLRTEQVRNPNLMLKQLDLTKVTVDASGALQGLDEQLTGWKTSDPYLFATFAEPGTGADGKGIIKPKLEDLQTQHAEALKSGKLAEAVSLKNQIFEAQKTI